MNNQIVTEKQTTCFECGEQISFRNKEGKAEYVKNKYGKFVKKRFNLDGSFHVCEKKQGQEQGQQQEYRSNDRTAAYWRYYWGYGPGKYHKDNEKRYSGEEYQQRRNQAREERQKWRENFSRNTGIGIDAALEILGLTREVLQKNFEEKLNVIKSAYRKLVLKCHPDRVQGEEAKKTAHNEFIKVTEAYETLTK
jgi:hypothetical protein